MRKIARRDFLKAVPVTASALASAAAATAPAGGEDVQRRGAAAAPTAVDTSYTPLLDYPIRAQPYFDVTLTDGFWKRKVDTNATVTIPLEVHKLTETPRGLTGNVLEAAILSLRTHPDPRLQRPSMRASPSSGSSRGAATAGSRSRRRTTTSPAGKI
jgi:hypothetical protein